MDQITCTKTPFKARLEAAADRDEQNPMAVHLDKFAQLPLAEYLRDFPDAYGRLCAFLRVEGFKVPEDATVADAAGYARYLFTRQEDPEGAHKVARFLMVPFLWTKLRREPYDFPCPPYRKDSFLYRFHCCGTGLFLRYPKFALEVRAYLRTVAMLYHRPTYDYFGQKIDAVLGANQYVSFISWLNYAVADCMSSDEQVQHDGRMNLYRSLICPLLVWKDAHEPEEDDDPQDADLYRDEFDEDDLPY